MNIQERKQNQETSWYTSQRFFIISIIALSIIIIYQGITGIFFRENDFHWHYNKGLDFLAGEPYKHGGDWYTVGRMMINAVLALQNYYVARATSFFLALAALTGSIIYWNRIVNNGKKGSKSLGFASAVFSIGLLSPFILRDLDDCGLQIFLLFFLTSAAYAISLKRSISCGFWLGLAATYKTSPLLFLPFLLWKRQWKAAFWMVFFIILLNLIPALFIGWQKTISSNLQWIDRARQELKVQDVSHPTSFEPPRHQNQSLPFSIARYLRTYPPGHALYIDHPLFFQFGYFEPRTTNYLVKGILIIFAGIFAYYFRHRWKNNGNNYFLAKEWATVCLFTALLSPLSWLHHLALALPCLFITIHGELKSYNAPRWHLIIFAVIGFKILLLNRLFLGHDLSILMLSYKLDTLAVLTIMMLMFSISPTDKESETIKN